MRNRIISFYTGLPHVQFVLASSAISSVLRIFSLCDIRNIIGFGFRDSRWQSCSRLGRRWNQGADSDRDPQPDGRGHREEDHRALRLDCGDVHWRDRSSANGLW